MTAASSWRSGFASTVSRRTGSSTAGVDRVDRTAGGGRSEPREWTTFVPATVRRPSEGGTLGRILRTMDDGSVILAVTPIVLKTFSLTGLQETRESMPL